LHGSVFIPITMASQTTNDATTYQDSTGHPFGR
jgi:hypothetical protein